MQNITKICFLFLLLLSPVAGLAQSNNGMVAINDKTIKLPALFPPSPRATVADPPATHVSAWLGVHAVTNNAGSPGGAATKQNIGVNVGVGYQIGRYGLHAEGFSGDANQTRARYFADYGFRRGEIAYHVGGGAFRFGTQTGPFAHVRADYDEWSFTARAGYLNFYEAEAAYRFDLAKQFGIQPFGRYTRHSVGGVNTRLFQLGLRATFGN